MKPLVWAAIGGAITLGIGLLARRASAATSAPPPAPDPTPAPTLYGETTRVALAVPAGWRRVTSAEVTPELSVQANALLNQPGFTSMSYGTLSPFTASDGRTYAAWVEQHYHEPGGTVTPWGLHHGVTLLARVE